MPALFPVNKDGKYGFIDASGRLVVPFRYKFASDFSEGLAVVSTEEGCGYIDEVGQEVIPTTLYWGGPFSEALACVRLTSTKYGYIRRDGSVAFEVCAPYPASWYDFHEGLAVVHYGGGELAEYDDYGYIDTTGTMVIPLVFRSASPFSEGLACVSTRSFKEAPFYIDKSGKIALNPAPWRQTAINAWSFSEGLAKVKWYRLGGGGVWGFITRDGKKAFEREFLDADSFSEGLAPVKGDGGKWGYIDKTGATVIDFRFDWAHEFSERLARVSVGSKTGFIDHSGDYAIEPLPLEGSVYECSSGLIRVTGTGPGGVIGYLDRTGKAVWPPAE